MRNDLFFTCNCLFVLALTSAGLPQPLGERIIMAKMLISQGVDEWNEQGMLDARRSFEELLPRSEERRWLVHYYIAYADFRLTTYYRAQDQRDLQLKYLGDGLEHLYACLNLKEDFADGHALLALLAGQKARVEPSQMASQGLEALAAISKARELGKENPRVAMISGIMYTFTPERFGGDRTKAMEEIKRSVSLFETLKPDDARLPDWGHSEALAWLGRLHMEAGELELANQSLEESLKVNPHNRAARRVKLQLEERMKSP